MKLKKKRYLLCILIIIHQISILSAFPVSISHSPVIFNSTENEIIFNNDHQLHRTRRATNFCYQTEKGARDVEKPTVEACVKHCWYLRKHIALIRQGKMCTCLAVLQDATKVEMSECDKPCEGNKKQNCGGDESYAAYETGYVKEPNFRGKLYYTYSIMRQHMRQGCFLHKAGRLEFRTLRMYPVLCVSMCFKYKYNLAGVFQGEGCTCIPSIGRMKRISDKKCRMKCPGRSLLKCGGRKKETVVFKTQGRFPRGAGLPKSKFTPPNWLMPKQVGPHGYDYFKGKAKGKTSAMRAKQDDENEDDASEYDDISPDIDFSKQRKAKKLKKKIEKPKPVKPKISPKVKSLNLGDAHPQNGHVGLENSNEGDSEAQNLYGGSSDKHSGYNRGQRRGRNGRFRQNRGQGGRQNRRFGNNGRRFGRNRRRNRGMNRRYGNRMGNGNSNRDVASKTKSKTTEITDEDEEEKKPAVKTRGKRNGDKPEKKKGRRRRKRKRRRRRKGKRRRRKGKQGKRKKRQKKKDAKKDVKGKGGSKIAALKIGNKTIGDSVSVKEVGKIVEKASSTDSSIIGPIVGGVLFFILFICICNSWRKSKAAEKKKQEEEEEMRRKKRRKKRKKKKRKKEKEAAEAEAEEEG